ncbi:hypothetical protein E2C01_054598 [Portunus trituberculatus]|uniref:Uncharacterized protein n=1 Tax=Portunus trituberculatus TaxID=210409 RepID=A0A5B7GSG3_PORTR|nr:hypothetical protein [Portunus trituberculatus]
MFDIFSGFRFNDIASNYRKVIQYFLTFPAASTLTQQSQTSLQVHSWRVSTISQQHFLVHSISKDGKNIQHLLTFPAASSPTQELTGVRNVSKNPQSRLRESTLHSSRFLSIPVIISNEAKNTRYHIIFPASTHTQELTRVTKVPNSPQPRSSVSNISQQVSVSCSKSE